MSSAWLIHLLGISGVLVVCGALFCLFLRLLHELGIFPRTNGCYAVYLHDGTDVTVSEYAVTNGNLSRAGYPLDGNYSGTDDSDGDGISDHDEIFVHDTDPWLADSDGDGLTDAEEIEAGTNPCDLNSFYRRVTVVTSASDTLPDTTNYVTRGSSPTGWEYENETAWSALPSTNVYDLLTAGDALYVKAYRDLDRNGRFDADRDVMIARQVPPMEAVSFFELRFGDIDGDGVSDADERQNGTDPYDGGSFRMAVNVTCPNGDTQATVTNYLSWSEDASCISGNGMTAFTGDGALPLAVSVTNGVVHLRCWRDFNRNGVYDPGVDTLYSRTLTKTANGTSVAFAIGDADSDGFADSYEIQHGTDPGDGRSYCYRLALVEKGIFSTTNQLTAEIVFGTNVIAGPVVMTGRVWTVDCGHLVASNRESARAYFWDDVNSNGLREEGECCVTQSLKVTAHDCVITNTLAYGTFDRDGDGMPDWWEIIHAEADLSPTNKADALLDKDGDGLINLHEFWAGCDPFVPDGSNTLLSVLSRSVDDRLLGIDVTNDTSRFDNFYANASNDVFVANTNLWIKDVDLSCVSVWHRDDNGDGYEKRGTKTATAITRRHVILSHHWQSDDYRFCDTNGTVVIRSLVGIVRISGDLCLGRLDQPLPAAFSPTYILPLDYTDYLKNGKYLPVVCVNEDQQVTALEIEYLDGNANYNGTILDHYCKLSSSNLIDCLRPELRPQASVGQSSSPVFLIMGSVPILLFEKHLGTPSDLNHNPTYGPMIASNLVRIQAQIDSWEGLGTYRLNVVDLSAFEKLER